ncbi:MAG: hypothetical protein PHU63_03600 [Candidatus ainarchaeum sp.]|nr:hypothetical protein [Candidatus ainarchaeum sp.]
MLVTTSSNSSIETKKFALSYSKKENYYYLNRGKKTISELVFLAFHRGYSKIAVVSSGNKIDFISIISSTNWKWER